MDDPAVFISQSAIVWFLVLVARAWLPGEVRDYIDGPARVWGLVLVAAGLVVMLDAGGWDAVKADYAAAALDAIALAITAVGLDNVQNRIPDAARELNLNIGNRSLEDDE